MPINLPVRLLPVAERWDCHGCGICCRHVIIPLSAEEYERIRHQGWEKDAELTGRRFFVRLSWFKSQYRLAHRPDGFCVFLSAQGRCRIHEKFGAEAKPLICRMFPYQLVPLDRFAYLTLRHNCPSVVSQQGRSLEEQRDIWQPLVEHPRLFTHSVPPPPLTATYRGNWNQFLQVANCVERLLTDDRYPMVRRLVHIVVLAQLLDRCRLARLDAQRFTELIGLLERSTVNEAKPLFGERLPPFRTAQLAFRRCLIEYYRLHPGYRLETSWRGRFHWILTAWNVARGRGKIPPLREAAEALRVIPALTPVQDITPPEKHTHLAEDHASQAVPAMASPIADLDLRDRTACVTVCGEKATAPHSDWVDLGVLNKSLGAIHRDVFQPLDDYYEKMAISKRHAVCGRKGWPLTDRIRALAMSFAAGLALLRLACAERPPTLSDVAAVVIALDRGETYQPLASPIYRRRLRLLDRSQQLTRLLLWYSR
ncbi:MAG: YkgJ family cysteine cluster protein [Thermogutta sp.]